MDKEVLLSVRDLVKDFSVNSGLKKKHTHAVNHVSLDVYRGETLGVVGESGCGKSTFGRVVLGLIPRTSGEVFYGGTDVFTLKGKELRNLRGKMQIVFQDPAASLNPRMTVGQIVAEPLQFHQKLSAKETKEKVRQMLDLVHLPEGAENKYPHEFSGGQQQRVGIARAFVSKPKIIFADEPTGNLDSKTTREVMELMVNLCRKYKETFVLVTHDRDLALYADRIITLADGEIIKDERNQSIARTEEQIAAEQTAMESKEESKNMEE